MGADLILDRLTRLYPKTIEIGLERTLRVLNDIGNPHLKLPPTMHIAGTNGKGSTLAFIRAVLESSGKKTHVMTSPHLVKFNERIVIASEEISDTDLENLLTRIETLNAQKPITFFEITTAAGFLAFAENKADFCLLETGMGGRLDSTNVIEKPVITIITNISLDHTQHLGNSLREIAAEKAGIMKADTPCIIGPQTENALAENIMEIFGTRAKKLNAPLYRFGHEWHYEAHQNSFTLHFENQKLELPLPNLLGAHQIANAATALVSLLVLDAEFAKNFSAIKKAHWPARLQRLTSGALYNLLPPSFELWLDGGHNEAGGKILSDQLRAWREADNKPLHLILGMLTTKDPRPFFDHLRPYLASATAISIPDEKLAYKASDLGQTLDIPSQENTDQAIELIIKNSNSGRILITGSLYLAGHTLSP